jgi:glycosyltransferase involved in cell wall biosynthesis
VKHTVNDKAPILVRITTVPLSFEVLLTGQMKFMSEHGFKVYMISSAGKNVKRIQENEGCEFIEVEMSRLISPFKDIKSLFKLIKELKELKPLIVHTHTPKAGLLGMLAAWFCKVPVRMHTVAGLPLMETTAFKRKLLILVEKVTYRCADFVYPNSFALKEYIQNNKFASSRKLKLIANGSSNGIDTAYFKRSDETLNRAQQLRNELGILPTDITFIFIGRVVKDKGINELVHAFNQLTGEYGSLKLLIVGPFEDDLDPIDDASRKIINSNKNIITTGFVHDVRPYLAASSILAFPSYREGFPNVPLQAGCMELPMIVTDINGCNEIVQNEINGLIIPAKSTDALYTAMEKMITDEALRKKCATASRQAIIDNFSRDTVWQALLAEYTNLLHRKGINFTHVSEATETIA